MRVVPRIKTRDVAQYCYDEDAHQADAAAQTSARFRHDPYGETTLGRVYVGESQDQHTVAPSGTLHAELWGVVSFMPYPKVPFVCPPDVIYPCVEQEATVPVFIGQLPYFITEMQLAWILYTFGGKHGVLRPEQILKRNAQSGERQPTGCIHAVGTRAGLARMAMLMHKRLLIDDTGVWFCRNETEYSVLWEYCQAMKRDIKLRPWEMPYDSVVVQEAVSCRHTAGKQKSRVAPERQAPSIVHNSARARGGVSFDLSSWRSNQHAQDGSISAKWDDDVYAAESHQN